MKKLIIAALVLLLAQIGLSVTMHLGNKGIEGGGPDTPFISFAPADVETMELTDVGGESITMKRDKDGWLVPGHFGAPVETAKVTELLGKIAALQKGFVVATSDDAARRFKVDKEGFGHHVLLKNGESTVADFYVGTSPAFRQVHARLAGGKEIVAVALSGFELESSLDKWLDSSVATIKDEDLQSLNLGELTLTRSEKGWQLENLQDGEEQNRSEVDALVAKAKGLKIKDVLDPAVTAELMKEPSFRFTVSQKGDKKVEYLFREEGTDSYVMKLSDRDAYYEVAGASVEWLRDISRDDLIVKDKEEPTTK